MLAPDGGNDAADDGQGGAGGLAQGSSALYLAEHDIQIPLPKVICLVEEFVQDGLGFFGGNGGNFGFI